MSPQRRFTQIGPGTIIFASTRVKSFCKRLRFSNQLEAGEVKPHNNRAEPGTDLGIYI